MRQVGWEPERVAAGELDLGSSAPTTPCRSSRPAATHERWGKLAWTPASVGSVVYLAAIGSGLGFVVLTVLLRQLSAVAMSCVHLLVPFHALGLGAAFNGETPGLRAVGGAGLVSAGLLIVQAARRASVQQPLT